MSEYPQQSGPQLPEPAQPTAASARQDPGGQIPTTSAAANQPPGIHPGQFRPGYQGPAQPAHQGGRYPGQPPSAPVRRSPVRIVFGVLLLLFGGLAILGQLARLAQGYPLLQFNAGSAEFYGQILGILLFIVGPVVAGVLLLRVPAPRTP